MLLPTLANDIVVAAAATPDDDDDDPIGNSKQILLDALKSAANGTVQVVAVIDFTSVYTWIVLAIIVYLAFRWIIQSSFSLMDHICSRTYIYNCCWEDPAIDQEILQIQRDDVIFRICSAGDIVLDYAIEGPAKIVVCDMNQHQLWLFELKIRMLRDPALTYDEWWGIWGSSDVNIAMKV